MLGSDLGLGKIPSPGVMLVAWLSPPKESVASMRRNAMSRAAKMARTQMRVPSAGAGGGRPSPDTPSWRKRSITGRR